MLVFFNGSSRVQHFRYQNEAYMIYVNTLKIKKNTTKQKVMQMSMKDMSNFINRRFKRKKERNEVMRFGYGITIFGLSTEVVLLGKLGGNEVFKKTNNMGKIIHSSTEVVLLGKLGGNEVFKKYL